MHHHNYKIRIHKFFTIKTSIKDPTQTDLKEKKKKKTSIKKIIIEQRLKHDVQANVNHSHDRNLD